MSLLKTVTDFASKLTNATAEVRNLIAERRRQIAEARHQLEHAETGPRPPAEVITEFETWVDGLAAYTAREHGFGIVAHRFGSVIPGPTAGSPWTPNQPMTWGWAAYFLGEQLKRRFADLVRGVEYEPGPPAAERPTRIAELREQLAALEREEEQLVDDAEQAGVRIDHRPEVLQARETERRAKAREEQAAADRAAREKLLNERHERRIGASEYLAQSRRG
jgi:hypothetical protein